MRRTEYRRKYQATAEKGSYAETIASQILVVAVGLLLVLMVFVIKTPFTNNLRAQAEAFFQNSPIAGFMEAAGSFFDGILGKEPVSNDDPLDLQGKSSGVANSSLATGGKGITIPEAGLDAVGLGGLAGFGGTSGQELGGTGVTLLSTEAGNLGAASLDTTSNSARNAAQGLNADNAQSTVDTSKFVSPRIDEDILNELNAKKNY